MKSKFPCGHGLTTEVIDDQGPAIRVRLHWRSEGVGRSENDSCGPPFRSRREDRGFGHPMALGVGVSRLWSHLLIDPSAQLAVDVCRGEVDIASDSDDFGAELYEPYGEPRTLEASVAGEQDCSPLKTS